jgi:ferritin-like protein
MAEEWHAPYDRLSRETLTVHQAIRSLMEELEAVDWYRQRSDDCADPQLRAVLLHNMREEIEHACMVLEWLRRNHPDFARQMDIYLYSQGDITEVEEQAEAGDGRSDPDRV